MEVNSAGNEDCKIKHVVAVMSGKGGVGKSVVTGVLAVGLRRLGLKVGVLDGDLACPSIIGMFGVESQISLTEAGEMEPLESKDGIKIMGMNIYMEDEDQPLVWRGPMVSSAFRQFYTDVAWGQLDYLLVDVPTGTSDVPVTVLESLPLEGVVIISSPQVLATVVAKKCINMVHQYKHNIIGLIENMAYFLAPQGEYYELFGASRSDELLSLAGSPLLGQLPIDPKLTALCDGGRVEEYQSQAAELLVVKFLDVLKTSANKI